MRPRSRVERATGFKLTINGSTKIGVWPSLNIALNDVALQDPKDRDTGSRLTAGSIQSNVSQPGRGARQRVRTRKQFRIFRQRPAKQPYAVMRYRGPHAHDHIVGSQGAVEGPGR